MKKQNYKVPVDHQGALMSYGHCPSKWVDPFEFYDTLTYIDYERGRSSCVLLFQREKDNTKWPVFMSNAHDIIPLLQNGQLTGRFRTVKKGANFGIAYEGPAP